MKTTIASIFFGVLISTRMAAKVETEMNQKYQMDTVDNFSMQALMMMVKSQDSMLQQQAALLQQQAARLDMVLGMVTSLQARLYKHQGHARAGHDAKVISDMLEVKLTALVENLTASIGNSGEKNNKADSGDSKKSVAFTAHMTATGVDVGHNGPFVFDKTITNIGDCYNNHSGIFIAPYDGVYVFSFIMINDGAHATIHAQIEKDGQFLGAGTSDAIGTNNQYDDGSALVTTHLQKGNHVYVTRRDAGTRVYGNIYTNFSGFLLAVDA